MTQKLLLSGRYGVCCVWKPMMSSLSGRSSRRPVWGRISVIAALGWLASGCNAPQIPLPPPVIEDLSFALTDAPGSLGMLRGTGQHTPEMANSSVRVLNLRDQHGVITPASEDGSFETRPFEVRDGDDLQVDYVLDAERSDGLCITVTHAGPLGACAP